MGELAGICERRRRPEDGLRWARGWRRLAWRRRRCRARGRGTIGRFGLCAPSWRRRRRRPTPGVAGGLRTDGARCWRCTRWRRWRRSCSSCLVLSLGLLIVLLLLNVQLDKVCVLLNLVLCDAHCQQFLQQRLP